jgi:hypothetical protein
MAIINFNESTLSWTPPSGSKITFMLRNWNESQGERTMADVTRSGSDRRIFIPGLAGEKVWTAEILWEPKVTNAEYSDWEGWVKDCQRGVVEFNFPDAVCSATSVSLQANAWLKGYEITGELDEAFIVSTTWSIDDVLVGTGP